MDFKTILNINVELMILLIISFTFHGCIDNNDLTNILNSLNVYMDVKGYKIIEDGLVGDDPSIRDISAISNKDIIKIRVIKNLSEEKANKYISNEKYLIESLFNEQTIPYPGFLTRFKKCPEKYLPKIEENRDENSWRIFYYLYANNRLTYGGCTDDILDYVAVLAFIYCKEKKEVYKIEYFTPKDNPTLNYKEIVKSFKCKK